MVNISTLVTVASSAAEKIKFCGEATFQLTKSSLSLCREKVDTEKLLAYASGIAISCQNVVMDVRSNARLYLRPEHLDMFLKQIAEQILNQDRIQLSLVCVHSPWKYRTSLLTDPYNNLSGSFSKRNVNFNDILAKVIWYEFNEKETASFLSKLDGKMRNWNKRINEKELVQKLGAPAKWDIFYDNCDADESYNIYEKETDEEDKDIDEVETQLVKEIKPENVKLDECLHHLQKAEDFKKRVMETGNSYLTNDLRQPLFNIDSVKQKKRSGVLHSIKKMFKSEKTFGVARPNNSTNNTHEEEKYEKHCRLGSQKSEAQKNVKNSNPERAESDAANRIKENEDIEQASSKETRAIAADPGREDTDNNSLMIHIPNNVQKIVLIKDGHKIKLEI